MYLLLAVNTVTLRTTYLLINWKIIYTNCIKQLKNCKK